MRDERYKLISFADGRAELYDLAEDPLESRDLLAGTPAHAERGTRAAATKTAEALRAEANRIRGG
ncbi:MAG: hypothetical protein ACRCZD_16190 [Phycicoccus sp.]